MAELFVSSVLLERGAVISEYRCEWCHMDYYFSTSFAGKKHFSSYGNITNILELINTIGQRTLICDKSMIQPFIMNMGMSSDLCFSSNMVMVSQKKKLIS
jgi:hypothetical protein